LLPTIVEKRGWPEPPLLFREKLSDPPGKTDTAPSGKTREKIEKAVLCRSCRSVVTEQDKAISIDNNHMHTFFNLAGIVFETHCFSQVKGCINQGTPTDEFSWFSGYTWEYALCSTCFDHLGWFYNSADSSFFGLIGSKIIQGDSPA